MTCDDFKKCNSGGAEGILALTRAERSAAGHHFAQCRACREWSKTFTIAVTAEQAARLRRAKCEDFLDPEAHHFTTEERATLLGEEESGS